MSTEWHKHPLPHLHKKQAYTAHVHTKEEIQSTSAYKDDKECLNWKLHWLVNKFVIGIDPKYLKL